jgi:D-tyrosyl-tRNA(Tyr) deacylase
MKIVVQRVLRAEVCVDTNIVGHIGPGLLVFLGIEKGDGEEDASLLVRKLINLRIFPGKSPMDRSIREVGGDCLVVSQFTLLGNTNKGNRPSFEHAEEPLKAERLYASFVLRLKQESIPTATGIFGADMKVSLENDGPVTFILEAQQGAFR